MGSDFDLYLFDPFYYRNYTLPQSLFDKFENISNIEKGML